MLLRLNISPPPYIVCRFSNRKKQKPSLSDNPISGGFGLSGIAAAARPLGSLAKSGRESNCTKHVLDGVVGDGYAEDFGLLELS
jgi:hypothetical protein